MLKINLILLECSFCVQKEKNERFREKCSTGSRSSHVLFREMLGESVRSYPPYSRNSKEADSEGDEMWKGVGRAGGDKVGVIWTRPC